MLIAHRRWVLRCLVFECMWDNLRVALKKYTKNNGSDTISACLQRRELPCER